MYQKIMYISTIPILPSWMPILPMKCPLYLVHILGSKRQTSSSGSLGNHLSSLNITSHSATSCIPKHHSLHYQTDTWTSWRWANVSRWRIRGSEYAPQQGSHTQKEEKWSILASKRSHYPEAKCIAVKQCLVPAVWELYKTLWTAHWDVL